MIFAVFSLGRANSLIRAQARSGSFAARWTRPTNRGVECASPARAARRRNQLARVNANVVVVVAVVLSSVIVCPARGNFPID